MSTTDEEEKVSALEKEHEDKKDDVGPQETKEQVTSDAQDEYGEEEFPFSFGFDEAEPAKPVKQKVKLLPMPSEIRS